MVAPYAMPSSAQADPDTVAFQERIHQSFTPNASPEDDLVYAEVPIEKIPEPEPAPEPEPSEESGAASAPAAAPRYTGGGSPAEWMTAAGIPESDWGYVDYVVSRESGWNPNATNAGSGACGLVQALPCSKVPGNGYDPVDNLRWATGYATGRYGSWAGAYDFWVANNWW